MLASADQLVHEVRAILLAAQQKIVEPVTVAENFQDAYFFILEYKNKILKACENQNELAAELAAFRLQEELSQLLAEVPHDFYSSNFNLLSEYASAYKETGWPDLLAPAAQGNLEELVKRTEQLASQIKIWYQENSIPLNIFNTEQELRRFLSRPEKVC